MSDRPRRIADEDIAFRTLAAPGLDEDDLFAAMCGLPGELLWGTGMPSAFAPAETPVDDLAQRHARHEALMRKWAAWPRDVAESGGVEVSPRSREGS